MPTEPFSLRGRRVWVAGHRGMVGAAIVRQLQSEDCEILTVARRDVDLRDQAATSAWILDNRPDVVVLAAAKVGGILANDSYAADFLFDNLAIETNIIETAHRAKVAKLLFLGSSCIYPKFASQPIEESSLLTGPLEPSNEWYAIAKIAGLKLCQAYRRQHGNDFISAMPTNLYGQGDNYNLQTSHVIPALLRKAHDAKQKQDATFTVWGSGTPRREFLHVDDCAAALIYLLKHYSDAEAINVGCGQDVSIRELAELIAEIVGYRGEIVWDHSKPDGTQRKLLDVSKLLALGWRASIGLRDGLSSTYSDFVETAARMS